MGYLLVMASGDFIYLFKLFDRLSTLVAFCRANTHTGNIAGTSIRHYKERQREQPNECNCCERWAKPKTHGRLSG